MTALQGQLTTFTIPEQKPSFGIMKPIGKYIYHWPLFILSFLVIFPLAWAYIKVAPEVYAVKASILIKADKKNQDKDLSALHEIDLVNSAKVIENEIEIIKSVNLLRKVVDDLNLSVIYQTKENFKTIDLFEDKPVELTLTKPFKNAKPYFLNIKAIDTKTFGVRKSDGTFKKYTFGQQYSNPVLGTWCLKVGNFLSGYLGKEIKITIINPEQAALNYQDDIKAELSNKLSSTVVLSLADRNPERGKAILNSVLIHYNTINANDKNADVKNTMSFLDQKISKLSEELGRSEKGLENFKSSNGLTDLSLQSKVSLENLQVNDQKLTSANIQLNIINRIDQYVSSSENAEKVPSSNGIDDDVLSSLIEKLSGLQLKYEELAATTPETSPEFEAINRQIKTTKSTIRENVKNIKATLLSTRDKLAAYNSKFETSIRTIPTQEREFINIKRGQASKESLYTYYLQKREEAAANYTSILSDDKIIDQAYATAPKDPKMMILVMAFVMGIGLPTGFIFARTALANKVYSEQDIRNVLDVPIITELPMAVKRSKIVVSGNKVTPVSEQFRSLRSKLYHLYSDEKLGRVTLITSSIPGEGKSFVSANLAVSLSLIQRKVVILELDMRKPKICKTFDLSDEGLGLSDYFKGEAPLEAIIRQTEVSDNLYVIAAGTPVQSPSELLESAALENLINELRTRFDDVIIDSPPAHLVADPLIVAKFANISLYVVRQGFTNNAELMYLKKLLEQQHFKQLQIVFNGMESRRYGYGYNYDNSYYSKEKSGILQTVFGNFFQRF